MPKHFGDLNKSIWITLASIVSHVAIVHNNTNIFVKPNCICNANIMDINTCKVVLYLATYHMGLDPMQL